MGCPLKIIITSIITTALLSISLYLLINKISYKEQSSTVIPYSIEMLKNITFISDIIVLDSDQCPPNYKIQNLGLWVGFEENGCFCKTIDGEIFTATTSECKKETYNDLKNKQKYECKKISRSDHVDIKSYHKRFLCVKEHTKTL